jgi:hypothetical protein
MHFWFTNKLLGLWLIPIRYLSIRYFKLDDLTIDFKSECVVIIDKGVNLIKWKVENAYLVKISNLGFVNSSGEKLFSNNKLPKSITITAYGYSGASTETIRLKIIPFDWKKIISSEFVERETRLTNNPKFIQMPIVEVNITTPTLKLKKPIIELNVNELFKELETNKLQKS